MRSLFSPEEVESILSQLSEVLTIKNGSECTLSPRELWRLFVKVYMIISLYAKIKILLLSLLFSLQKVLDHLHIILCVTPLSPVLTVLYKSYQSVISHCTIDMFDEWSSNALFGLAGRNIMERISTDNNLKLSKVFTWLMRAKKTVCLNCWYQCAYSIAHEY